MTEIRVPTLGESVTEATIGKWFKKAGDAVKVQREDGARAADVDDALIGSCVELAEDPGVFDRTFVADAHQEAQQIDARLEADERPAVERGWANSVHAVEYATSA